MVRKNTSTPVTKTTLDELAEKASQATRERYEQQKANGVINPIILAALVDVRPQMVYNYLRKGKFTDVEDAVEYNNTGKKVIHLDEANTWAKGYIERKVERETKDAEKIASELAGSNNNETVSA